MPISRALLGISFGVPSKGALPLGSPRKAPTEREREMLRFQSPPSFIFQRPRYTSPLPGAPAGPLWRHMPVSKGLGAGTILILVFCTKGRDCLLFSPVQSILTCSAGQCFARAAPLLSLSSMLIINFHKTRLEYMQ